MLLNIPVLDLLHSQFDIELNVGVDPFSGKATYNVKDIHSRPRQPHSLSLSLAGDLTLALLNSPEESPSDPGTLCIRISPAQVAMSEQGLANMPEVPLFHPANSPCLSDQSERSAHLMAAGTLMPAVHVQDSFGNVDCTHVTYGQSAGGQASLDNQGSLWTSLPENAPQPPDVSGPLSPLSQTLSLVTSGSIGEDFVPYSSPSVHTFGDSQFDPTSIQADYTRYPTDNATYSTYQCPQDPIYNWNTIDIQGQAEVEGSNVDTASCGSFSIIDLFTPAPDSGSSSRTSSAAVSPQCDQISLESHTSTPSHSHDVSVHEAYPTSSSGQGKSPAQPAKERKRNLFPCPFPSCGRILKSMYTQRIHLKTHESKPPKYFPCTMGCPESFTRHHDRLRHEVAQHGKQCEFSCKHCERFFSSQRMLDRHTCWNWRNGGVRWQRKDSPLSEA